MDIQEAIDCFKREKLYWDTMIKYRNAKGEIPDNVTETYNYFDLAIQALKEKQEREKSILDVSQVKTGCMVHDKVYSPVVLLSYPPQYKWICRKCGAEGIDTIGEYADNEYERLKREKQVEQSQDYNFEVGV